VIAGRLPIHWWPKPNYPFTCQVCGARRLGVHNQKVCGWEQNPRCRERWEAGVSAQAWQEKQKRKRRVAGRGGKGLKARRAASRRASRYCPTGENG